jgi:hypothetical protein
LIDCRLGSGGCGDGLAAAASNASPTCTSNSWWKTLKPSQAALRALASAENMLVDQNRIDPLLISVISP